MSQDVLPNTEILNSWKEIAHYFDRGVRTVQRWEALGLPIRRPHGRGRSAVFAIKSELDAWLRSCPTEAQRELLAGEEASNGHSSLPESSDAATAQAYRHNRRKDDLTSRLVLEAQQLRDEMLKCREQLRLAIEQLHKSLSAMSLPRANKEQSPRVMYRRDDSNLPN